VVPVPCIARARRLERIPLRVVSLDRLLAELRAASLIRASVSRRRHPRSLSREHDLGCGASAAMP